MSLITENYYSYTSNENKKIDEFVRDLNVLSHPGISTSRRRDVLGQNAMTRQELSPIILERNSNKPFLSRQAIVSNIGGLANSLSAFRSVRKI